MYGLTEKQTVEFNLKARAAFLDRKRVTMSVWEAMELLNTLIDESDPDVGSSFFSRPSVADASNF